MFFYKLTYIVEDEQKERLSALAKQYGKINGWNEEDVLQFAVSAFARLDMELKLKFLEKNLEQIKKEKNKFFPFAVMGTTSKSSNKKWSREWEYFKWEEVEKKLAEVEKEEYRNNGYDVGITNEEFIEFLDWLHENRPGQYYKILLALQLTECGLSDEETTFWLAHPEKLKEILDKIRNGEEV